MEESTTVRGIKAYILQDPTTSVNSEPSYAIFKGSLENSYQPFPSTSFSDSSWTFSIITPGPNMVVDRRIYIGYPVELTFTGNTGDITKPLLYPGFCDAFTAYPFHSVCTNIQATINNNTISSPAADLFPWLMKYSTFNDDEYGIFSQFPAFQDQSQRYEELLGSLLNPLGGYPGAAIPWQQKRGEFPLTIITNTSTSAVVRAYIVEPIIMSPFLFKQEREPGFYGVSTMTFNFNLDANLSKIWSHAIHPTVNNAFSNVVVKFKDITASNTFYNTAPTLFLRYSTPNNTVTLETPHYSPWYTIDRFPNDASGGLIGRAETIITSNNIQLNSLPKRIYIMARRRNADLTYSTTRTCAFLKNINVSFNNRTGLLASASPFDLYQMARRNGFNGSWLQWQGVGGVIDATSGNPTGISSYGSILAVDFGDDIGLPVDQSPGMSGTFQLLIRATIQNPAYNNEAVNYSLYIIVVNEGLFYTQNNQAYTSTGNINPGEINSSGIKYETRNVKHHNFYGGGLFDSLKAGVTKVANAWQKVSPMANKMFGSNPFAAPVMGMADMLAPALGSGLSFGGRKRHRGGNLSFNNNQNNQQEDMDEEECEQPRRNRGGATLSMSELRNRSQ